MQSLKKLWDYSKILMVVVGKEYWHQSAALFHPYSASQDLYLGRHAEGSAEVHADILTITATLSAHTSSTF